MQGTAQWKQMRLGKITASKAARAISNPQRLANQLLKEIQEGSEPSFSNAATDWGLAHEGPARALFSITNNVTVEQWDFIDHPRLPRVGCSPDGITNQSKLIEIKCPYNLDNHIIHTHNPEYFYKKYRWQIQHQLLCVEHLGIQACTLISYHPHTDSRTSFRELVQYDYGRDARDQATLTDAIHDVLRYMNIPTD